jgi:hypothetical protein
MTRSLPRFRVLPLLVAIGCTVGPPDEPAPEEIEGTALSPDDRDVDGDGYRAADDCDDADATVFPTGTERCGGGDENCDGTVDEASAADAPAWYADSDGDGFGDAGAGTLACEAPPGSVADATDCDDTDADVSPLGTEVCGGDDENCDGRRNEAEAADAAVWYADTDGDGFGDATTSEIACEAPPGAVADATDCDDTDAAVSPDGIERCGGGDEDCDGTVDEPDAPDASTWYTDADRDGFGDAASVTVACVAPVDTVSDATDCDDTDPTVSPEATERCGGGDEDCDGAVDESGATPLLTWYADTDGDGFGDATMPEIACTGPVGAVRDATDCDDRDTTVSPAGTERCGGGDEDCDGTVDEDAAADAPAWYADADEDGFGDAAAPTSACVAPSGTVSDATDCDDTDAAFHPGASDAGCDLVDEDCDGLAEGRVVFTDTAGTTTDLTATFAAGTMRVPVSYTLTSAGELAVCDGTWYTRLISRADPVSILGAGSDTTTLSAGGSGSVVTIAASGSVSLEGFTATGASTSAVYAGPAVTVDLSVDSVTIIDNAGTNGGGLHQERGTLTMQASFVTTNVAERGWGGGLYLLDVETSITNSDISGNGAYNSPAYIFAKGGGVYISPGALTMTDTTLDSNWTSGARGYGAALFATAPVHLERCDVTNNRVGASEYGGGEGTLYVADGTILDSWITDNTVYFDAMTVGIEQSGGTLVFDCSGGGGVLRNEGYGPSSADGARVFGTLVSIGCDWGTGADDNVYNDIVLGSWGGPAYTYGSAASFTCDAEIGTCY